MIWIGFHFKQKNELNSWNVKRMKNSIQSADFLFFADSYLAFLLDGGTGGDEVVFCGYFFWVLVFFFFFFLCHCFNNSIHRSVNLLFVEFETVYKFCLDFFPLLCSHISIPFYQCLNVLVSLAFDCCYNIVAHELLLKNENFWVLENVQTNLRIRKLFWIDVTFFVYCKNCALFSLFEVVTSSSFQKVELFLAFWCFGRSIVLNSDVLEREQHVFFHYIFLSQPNHRRYLLLPCLYFSARFIVDFYYDWILGTCEIKFCYDVHICLPKLCYDLLLCYMNNTFLLNFHYLLFVSFKVETFDWDLSWD